MRELLTIIMADPTHPDSDKGLSPVPFEDGNKSLSILQGIVGGYIELVPNFLTFNGRPCRVYCNDNKEGLQMNILATALWRSLLDRTGWEYVREKAVLYGNIAIVWEAPESAFNAPLQGGQTK